MAAKKKGEGSSDLAILDAAPNLDQRIDAALKISTKLADRWGLDSAVTVPGLNLQTYRKRVYSTGLLSLDQALGIGGLPRGHITEFFGPPGGGKSTKLYEVIAEVQHQCTRCDQPVVYSDRLDSKGRPQQQLVNMVVKGQETKVPVTLRTSVCTHCQGVDTGGLVMLFDQENSFDPVWVAHQGVELTKLLVFKLPSGEQASEMLRTLMINVKPEMVCIDSIAQLQPKAEQERSEVDDATLPGLHAKVMSRLCRSITAIFTMDPKNAPAVVWINQVRADMSGYNQPKVTGGFAPEHYSSIRLYFLPQQLVNQKDPLQGREGKITIYKGRVAQGLYRKTCEYVLLPTGFDKVTDIFNTATKSGVFNAAKQASGRFYWAEADATDNANELAYGRDKMIARIREEDSLREEIYRRVMSASSVQEPEEIFVGDEVPGQE